MDLGGNRMTFRLVKAQTVVKLEQTPKLTQPKRDLTAADLSHLTLLHRQECKRKQGGEVQHMPETRKQQMILVSLHNSPSIQTQMRKDVGKEEDGIMIEMINGVIEVVEEKGVGTLEVGNTMGIDGESISSR